MPVSVAWNQTGNRHARHGVLLDRAGSAGKVVQHVHALQVRPESLRSTGMCRSLTWWMSSGVPSLPSLPGIAEPPLELPAGDFDRGRQSIVAGLRIFTSAQAFIW